MHFSTFQWHFDIQFAGIGNQVSLTQYTQYNVYTIHTYTQYNLAMFNTQSSFFKDTVRLFSGVL